jgi:tetratricopeptide (TPR) repeat protein
MVSDWISSDVLTELRHLLEDRQIGAGIALLERHRGEWNLAAPDKCHTGLALGCLARWIDVGYEDETLLRELLERFPANQRRPLPLADYVELRMAEALVAMRAENLTKALHHLDTALLLSSEIEAPEVTVTASLWKARCLRKAGEYDQALDITRQGMRLAESLGLRRVAAVMRTLESWILFQEGKSQHAIELLQEAEAALRDTDDFITLGNIQSTYGRIALREGRYDHALQYFELSIDYFKRRPSLEGYLARSLTNIAQAKRLLALQLRRSLDSRRERLKADQSMKPLPGESGKAGQLERMHELLRNARADLAQADTIYRSAGNHHGTGNVDVHIAEIYLDLGDLDNAGERASEAFELGATKADYLLMCRARIVQAMVANARFEEQIGETEDPSRFAQLAHDCAKEALDLGERTESRRLLAQANICHGMTLVNGFFNNTENARLCCDRAEAYLNNDRHDALWQEVEILRARILHSGIEDPNLRAWSQGAVGDKSLQEVVGEFEELLIRRIWEHEGRKVSRVAHKLAVSPKKVRRVLRHLGLLTDQEGTAPSDHGSVNEYSKD